MSAEVKALRMLNTMGLLLMVVLDISAALLVTLLTHCVKSCSQSNAISKKTSFFVLKLFILLKPKFGRPILPHHCMFEALNFCSLKDCIQVISRSSSFKPLG